MKFHIYHGICHFWVFYWGGILVIMVEMVTQFLCNYHCPIKINIKAHNGIFGCGGFRDDGHFGECFVLWGIWKGMGMTVPMWQ